MDIEDPFHLSGIWMAELDILAAIAELCEKHGLRYYLSDGVALGSVRHQSFIPWDDDLDISMPRDDYDKFAAIAPDELPAHLKFVDWKNTPEFTLLMGKVQDSREDFIKELESAAGRTLSNGVYVDIFPIDGCPSNKFAELWIKFRDALLFPIERFHMHDFSHLSKKGKCAWLVGAVMSVFVPLLRTQQQFCALHERTLHQYKFDQSELVGRCCLDKNPYWRVPVKRSVWGTPKAGTFMGRKVMFPEDIEAHLRNEYGDYMKLPPEEKRRPGHSYSWRCPWWLGPTH